MALFWSCYWPEPLGIQPDPRGLGQRCARLPSLGGAWAGHGPNLGHPVRHMGLGRAWAERIGYWNNNALVIALRSFANLLPHHKQQVKKLRHATHFLQVDAGLFQNISYVASLEDVCSVFQTFASRYAARVRERSRFTRMRAPIFMDYVLPQDGLSVGFTERKKVFTWACSCLPGLGRA